MPQPAGMTNGIRPLAELPHPTPERIERMREDREHEAPMSLMDWVLGCIPLLIGAGLIVAAVLYWAYTQNHPGVILDFRGTDPLAR